MQRTLVIVVLGILVILSSLMLLAGVTSGLIVAITGFLFVFGGTMLITVASENYHRVLAVLRRLPQLFKESGPELGSDEAALFRVAELYRRGRVRTAEMTVKGFGDLYLRQGAQLIMDGCSREELERTLLWRLANVREEEKRRLRILYSMVGFAPAFGMLGTLLGLARMLFSLGDEGLAVVGAAMGFSIITTVYGLVAANLIIKPLAIKMEQRSSELLALQAVKYELLLMLFKKEHPTLMREALGVFKVSRSLSEPAPPPVGLVQVAS